MGSLASRPKVPSNIQSQSQVVYTPTNTTVSAVSTTETKNDTPSAEETASQARKQGLIGRERSRFGTVKTGFRGLLGLSDNNAQRKTLLGE